MNNKNENLIIIMSDEHQAKALGSVNHPFVKTPNLDKLASNGISAFKNNSALLKGLNVYKGKVTHPAVAESFNLNYSNPLELLK